LHGVSYYTSCLFRAGLAIDGPYRKNADDSVGWASVIKWNPLWLDLMLAGRFPTDIATQT